jgi:hypothetical protein
VIESLLFFCEISRGGELGVQLFNSSSTDVRTKSTSPHSLVEESLGNDDNRLDLSDVDDGKCLLISRPTIYRYWRRFFLWSSSSKISFVRSAIHSSMTLASIEVISLFLVDAVLRLVSARRNMLK